MTKEDLILKCIESLNDKMDRFHDRLFGNGEPGLITEVDRLKQSHKRQNERHSKLSWALITTIISAVVAYVFSWIKDN